MDKVTKEKRSEIMSKIHQPTKLEDAVREWLESEGIPHEMYPKVGGKPDMLLRNNGNLVYVFVDGCFWHCCPLHYRRPKTRKRFWITHLEEANIKREEKRQKLPYRWVRVWEHDVKSGEFGAIIQQALRGRIGWGYPSKSLEGIRGKLKRDLKFYGGNGAGNCAKLDERHPEIVPKTRKDGSVWYQIEVDDIVLDLELAQ